jgi:hypothetical protein
MFSRLNVSSVVNKFPKSRSGLAGNEYFTPLVGGFIGEYNATSTALTVQRMSIGPSGEICVVGYVSAGTPFVMRVLSTGEFSWAFTIPTDYPYVGCAINSSGQVHVATRNSNRAVLFQLSTSGSIVWQQSIVRSTGSPSDYAYSIAIDSSDFIYLNGGSNSFGTYEGQLIQRFNSGGSRSWSRRHGGGSFVSYPYGIATDGSSVYSVCHSDIVTGNGYDMAIAKHNASDGTLSWQRKVTTAGGDGDISYDVATYSGQNIVVAGYLGGTNIATLLSYNSSGTLQWKKSLGSGTLFYSCAMDSSGNIYALGSSSSEVTSLLIAKYNSSGALQWQRKITGSVQNPSNGQQDANIRTDGTYIYFSAAATVSGIKNLYVFKLPCDGSGMRPYTMFNQTITYSETTRTSTDAGGTDSANSLGTESITPTVATPTHTFTSLTTTTKKIRVT